MTRRPHGISGDPYASDAGDVDDAAYRLPEPGEWSDQPYVEPPPEEYTPLSCVARDLRMSASVLRGECQLLGIRIVDVAGYIGVDLLAVNDADRLRKHLGRMRGW